jgi:prepilin-type N-terminal cleavage/methylation domain-containing protein
MKSPATGFSLPELLVTMGLFAVLSMFSFVLMNRNAELWRDTSSDHAMQLEMNRASRSLESDLSTASRGSIRVAKVAGSFSGGADGDAVWFLSAENKALGEFARDTEGRPIWQRNILYYLIVPKQHDALYGAGCSTSPRTGNDSYCPHKVLIRKVIDSPPIADQASADPTLIAQSLLTEIEPYLSRPEGLDTSAMTEEPGVESARIIGTSLLYFEVVPEGREVTIDLRAVPLEGLGRKTRVGSVSLLESPSTRQFLKSFFPKNP